MNINSKEKTHTAGLLQVPLQPPPSLVVTAAAGAAAPEVTRSAAAQGGNFWRHTNRASVLNSQRAATQRAAGGGAARGGREAGWDRGGPSLPADRPPGPRSQSPPLAAMVTEASAVRVCGRVPRAPPEPSRMAADGHLGPCGVWEPLYVC